MHGSWKKLVQNALMWNVAIVYSVTFSSHECACTKWKCVHVRMNLCGNVQVWNWLRNKRLLALFLYCEKWKLFMNKIDSTKHRNATGKKYFLIYECVSLIIPGRDCIRRALQPMFLFFFSSRSFSGIVPQDKIYLNTNDFACVVGCLC